MTEQRPSGIWRPPTRRAFLAALGLGIAATTALASQRRARVADSSAGDDRPRSRWTGTTRWIGHC